MKKLIFLYLAIVLLSQPYSFSTESIIYNPPIPKPKISIEKAIELAREVEFKEMDDNAIKSYPIIIESVEYRSYHYIKETYSVDAGTMEKFSKDGNWEWLVKFSDTRMSDNYSIFMVTQKGVHLVEFCCL